MRDRLVLTVLAAGLLSVGCVFPPFWLFATRGNGVPAAASRTVEDFSRINLTGLGRVVVAIGAPSELHITGDENIIPLIQTSVDDGVLAIGPQENIIPDLPLIITVSVPRLTAVEMAGSGEFIVTGLNNERFVLEVTGVGRVELTGQTTNLTVAMPGAGEINTLELTAAHADVSLTGAGQAEINATETLDVEIASVGSVRYTGNPTITQEITGLGRLEPID